MTASGIPRHNMALDSMRALSSLAVFASHLVLIFWLPRAGARDPVYPVTHVVSETAVIIFFLLSGYLITMSIWKNITDNGHFRSSDFAVARIARIYPPLIAAILVSVGVFGVLTMAGLPGVAVPLRHPSDVYSIRDILTLRPGEIVKSLLMWGGLLQIDGPLWSLYIEVPLYAAAGAAALALKGRGGIGRVCGIITFAALTWFMLERGYVLYAAWWLMGAVFFAWRVRPGRLVWLAGAALAAVILAFSPASPMLEALRLCVLLGLSIAMFFFWRWKSPWLEDIAGISYTLYLVHFPLLLLAYSLFVSLQGAAPPSPTARLLAALSGAVATFTAAWFLGRQAEDTKRFRRLIRPFFRGRNNGDTRR